MRHVQTQYLFIQHLVKQGTVVTVKEDGKQNVADIGTKHLPRIAIDKILAALGMRLLLAGNAVTTADAGQVTPLSKRSNAFAATLTKPPAGNFTVSLTIFDACAAGRRNDSAQPDRKKKHM